MQPGARSKISARRNRKANGVAYRRNINSRDCRRRSSVVWILRDLPVWVHALAEELWLDAYPGVNVTRLISAPCDGGVNGIRLCRPLSGILAMERRLDSEGRAADLP